MSDLTKEEQKQDEIIFEGQILPEIQKNERKMFIFGNTFDLLLQHMVYQYDNFEIYPAL